MEAVRRGLEIGKEYDRVFTWLTQTNKCASEVCEAAISLVEDTEELAGGCPPDPASK